MKGARIVKAIQIKNFRSLKDTGLQTLSPITLLVGENSSGKSTFLRAFPLLKQSITKRTSGPILWAGDVDDYVDFGSFDETVTNDASNSIAFRFLFDIFGMGMYHRYISVDRFLTDNIAKSNYDEIDYEITIASTKGRDFVSGFKLTINNIATSFDLVKRTIRMDDDFIFTETISQSKNDKIGQNSRVPYTYISAESTTFGFTLPNIDNLWTELIETVYPDSRDDRKVYRIVEIIVDIGDALSRNTQLTCLSETGEKDSPYPSWYVKDYNKIISLLQQDSANRLVRIISLCYIYRVFSDIDEYITDYFKQVHYIAPLRATAERYYRLRNLAIDEVDYQGKNLAIFINSLTSKQLKDFHAWTNEHFGFTVSTDKSKGHLSLLIRLQDSKTAINLSDTGFGYSQVLPIITQLWELSSHKKNSPRNYQEYKAKQQLLPLVIAIEQPELHLHPAVQAKLAKAFIAAIKLARKNGFQLQLLLETHSETIVNYLGRAVAKGTLSCEDISVVLFDKPASAGITTVHNSSYDEDGYLENWPYGFFNSEE